MNDFLMNDITVYCNKSSRRNSKRDYKHKSTFISTNSNVKSSYNIDNLYEFISSINYSKYKNNFEVVGYLSINKNKFYHKSNRYFSIEPVIIELCNLMNIANNEITFDIKKLFENDMNLKYLINQYYNKGV